jgi:coenzyme F420 hydrogenase subunit delta
MNVEDDGFLPDFCTKPMLVLGCGNRLFGDDGFGCEVADYLQAHYHIPDDVYVMDVGTSARKLLFTLSLSPRRPRRIILVDAVDKGRRPGEIFELLLDDISAEKRDDFSLHEVPSSNLVLDLKDAGVDVRVIVCQVGRIPDSVEPGLSEPVARAVPLACAKIAELLSAVPLPVGTATALSPHPKSEGGSHG